MTIQIKDLDPKFYRDQAVHESKIMEWLEECDVAWVHDGDENKPHAELTSGKCSNGYFNCSNILRHPNLCEILAVQLVFRLQRAGIIARDVDWVIGSPYAAITFSYEVAKALKAIHGFAEKDPNDLNGKTMVWKRFRIPRMQKVLQVEELITTSQTFVNVRQAVNSGNSNAVDFISIVATLVHRPSTLPIQYDDGVKVVSLVERKVWAVEPSKCPLCKNGSKPLRPKDNWAELTRTK
ncbi:MAG: hypothetical protein ABH956_02160 [Candidatus Nealsonbacteria bacterium]